MKIKKGYVLRSVAGKNLVVSVGAADFSGMIVAKRRVKGYGFNKSERHEWKLGETDVNCVFAADALPLGSQLEFRAYAVESFGVRSAPLSSGVMEPLSLKLAH